MRDSGASSGRPGRGSGSFTVHPAEELEVYFNEVAHGRPVGFVASSKWKPPTDIYETDDALVVYMEDRKSTRLNSSHLVISYAVFCLKKTSDREIRSDAQFSRLDRISIDERTVARFAVAHDHRSIRASLDHAMPARHVRISDDEIAARP